jgi:DNA-directed RNA polymerase beta subunit
MNDRVRRKITELVEDVIEAVADSQCDDDDAAYITRKLTAVTELLREDFREEVGAGLKDASKVKTGGKQE